MKTQNEDSPRISLEFPSKEFKSIIASTFSELLEKELRPVLQSNFQQQKLLTKKEICNKLQIKPSTFEHHKEQLMEFGMFQPNGNGSSFRMRSDDLEKFIDHLINTGSLK